MNLLAKLAVGALLVITTVSASAQSSSTRPPKVCLNTRDILRSEATDNRTIVYHMRGGKVWSNKLRNNCPMLKISPYTQVLNSDLICSNQQFIVVALTGDHCALGDFTPVTEQR